jgi:hypothetical protein
MITGMFPNSAPYRGGCAARRWPLGLLLILAVSTATGESGSRTGFDPRLKYDDLAALKSREPRAELPCQVTPDKPSIGFDLRFHTEYHVAVPVNIVSSAGGWLEVAMRVMPTREIEHPTYMAHRFAIPAVPLGSKGEVVVSGGFDLGPGHYQVDWIMRDARERVCSSIGILRRGLAAANRICPLRSGQIRSLTLTSVSRQVALWSNPNSPNRFK